MWLRCAFILISFVQLAQLQEISEDCMVKLEALEKRIDAQRQEMDAQRQEMDELKKEVHYWQNTTLSILRKYTLNGPAEGSCDGAELKEHIQEMRNASHKEMQKIESMVEEKYNSIITALENGSRAVIVNKLEEVEEILELHDSEEEDEHEEIMDAIAAVNQVHNGTFHSPAVSCKHLKADHPASPSGQYWIQNPESGYASDHYCDMDRADCGGARGWMRIAYLDMDNPSHHCPLGFRDITSPVRACGRPSGTTCASVTFSTHGIRYRRVIGKVIGYQYKSTDGPWPYYNNRALTLDGVYVDGVSITHGQPRKHIWTFVAALDETRANGNVCPCTKSGATYTGVIPPFIGNDYFCETGSRYAVQYIFYDEDPLWDKEGCGGGSRCCNGSPFFCKELPHATTDDIELRLCCDGGLANEDTPLKLIELYVQ